MPKVVQLHNLIIAGRGDQTVELLMESVPHIDPKERAFVQLVEDCVSKKKGIGAVGAPPIGLDERPVVFGGDRLGQNPPRRVGDHAVQNRRKTGHPRDERHAPLPLAARGDLLVEEDLRDRVFGLARRTRRDSADRHVGERVAVKIGVPVVRGDMVLVSETVDHLGRNARRGNDVERRAERVGRVGTLSLKGRAVPDDQHGAERGGLVQAAELLPNRFRIGKSGTQRKERRGGLPRRGDQRVNGVPLRLPVEDPPLHRRHERAAADQGDVAAVRRGLTAVDGKTGQKENKRPPNEPLHSTGLHPSSSSE